MKGVVLAAGIGSRLRAKSDPKPLVRLGGLSLVERAVVTAHRAGVRELYVVVGHRGDQVVAHLEEVSARRRIPITPVLNAFYEGGNGTSVLAARHLVGENPFVLLMVDHVFDEALLAELLCMEPPARGAIAAVDYNVEDNLIDVDDATKMVVVDGHVMRIGKDLECYDAYDTGAFVCTAGLFEALEESARQDATGLSDGLQILADRSVLRAHGIGGGQWIDLDTPRDYRNAGRALYKQLGKPADGVVAAYLNRKLSRRLSTPLLLALYSRITPNQTTLLGFAVAAAAAIAFMSGQPLVAAVLVFLASVLDGSDGEIARLKKMTSPFGGFFDAVLDRYADGLIFLGVLGYLLSTDQLAHLFGERWLVPVVVVTVGLALVGHLVVSYTSSKAASDLGHSYRGPLVGVGKGRDLRLFILTLGAVFAWLNPMFLMAAMGVVALLTNAIIVDRLRLSWRASRDTTDIAWSKIRAVVFDFDGTIADSMGFLTETAVALLSANHGFEQADACRRYLDTSGLDFASQLEELAPSHPANVEAEQLFEERKLAGLGTCGVFDDVVPALDALGAAGIACYVCSSTTEEIVRSYCDRAGLLPLLRGVFGLRNGTGKAQQLAQVILKEDLLPEQLLFVGDSPRDADFARERGTGFIGVTRLHAAHEFRRQHAPSVSGLAELADGIRRESGSRIVVEPSEVAAVVQPHKGAAPAAHADGGDRAIVDRDMAIR